MEFKTTDFFDNTEVNLNRVYDYIMSNPKNTKEVLEFVIHKVEHFKEFEDKKEYEKMMYEHRVKELYAEYMKEN
jgi:hypothetical protein